MVGITAQQQQCENYKRKSHNKGLQKETMSISETKALSKDNVHNQRKVDFTSADFLSCKTAEKFKKGKC